jgi:LDH2 family malate/lactate/ureidoglycolate dehydrogenase
MNDSSVRVDGDALRAFAREIFMRANMPPDHAETVADILVWANLRGVDGHGVLRLPRYLYLIGLGLMNPRPEMREIHETPASVVIEADRALGPVALGLGMARAIDKARTAGLGLGLVRNTTHGGAVGYFVQQAVRENMVGIVTTTSLPNMAYHGARAPGVATSPLAIGVPGGNHAPLVLDMATAVASFGKLAQARHAGATLPEGWALTGDGEPTTDPNQAAIPMPLGGPKGAGLALMFECITSLLVGNPLVEAELTGAEGERRHNQNGFMLAIDIAAFIDVETYGASLDRMVDLIKALPKAPDTDEILVPGERGDRVLEERSRSGIPLAPGTWRALGESAASLGVDMPATV